MFASTGWLCPTCDDPFLLPTRAGIDTMRMAPVRGSRTYKVRGLLKGLKGQWDQHGKVWWVPRDQLNNALFMVMHRSDADPESGLPEASVHDVCWECGDDLPPRNRVPEFDDAYWCGCTD